MPSAQVAVSVDGVGSTVKDNCTSIMHSRNHHWRKNDWKQNASFHHMDDNYIPSSVTQYSTSFVSLNMVVVDGSTCEENNLKHPGKKSPIPWVPLQVRNGDLFVPKSHYETPTKGLKYSSDECIIKFCLLPRKDAIYSTIFRNDDRLYQNKECNALDDLEQAQQVSFQRGHCRHVFIENNKYYIAGVQPNRASTGVSSQMYHFSKMKTVHQDTIIDYIKKCESLMKKYISHKEVAVLYEARDRLKFKTMFANQYQSSLYSSIASAVNVHLHIHTDLDFCYSLTIVLIQCKKLYKVDGTEISYFNFPILGVAIPLCLMKYLCLMQLSHMQLVQGATSI